MKSKRRSFLILLAQIVSYFLLYFLLKKLLNQALISLSISSLVFAVVVRKNRTLKLLATLILVTSVIYLELKPNHKSRREYQQQQQRYNDSNIRSLSSLTNSSSYSFAIFFLESDPRRKLATTKETCAIESAAKNNPNALVMHYRAIVNEDQLARLVSKAYANVRLVKFESEKVFSDTPLLEWWKSISKSSTDSTYSQINEAFKYLFSLVSFYSLGFFKLTYLRLAEMWKYGGVYSDLDTIILKSFELLITNIQKSGFGEISNENESILIGSNFLIFRPKHPLIVYMMTRFVEAYNPNNEANLTANRTELFKNWTLSFCGLVDTDLPNSYLMLEPRDKSFDANNKQPDKSHPCSDLIVFPQRYFYPFSHRQNIMQRNSNLNYQHKIAARDAYSMHYFGEFSSHLRQRPNDNSFFSQMVAVHCPVTFKFVTEYSLEFF